MIRKVITIVLCASAVIVGGTAFLFFSEFQSSFPELQRGVYAGVLHYNGEDALQTPFLVDKTSSSLGTIVAVADDDFPPQVVPDVEAGGVGQPLIVSGPHGRLRLVGSAERDSGYSGDFIDPVNNRSGQWHLRPVKIVDQEEHESDNLVSWVEAWNDLTVVHHQTSAAEAKLAEQEAKIEKLQRFITDGDALRKKANSRLGATTDAVQEAREGLQRRQEEVVTAFRDLELSQQVSPRGRLVALARESIAREARAIEASLQILSPSLSPDFEKALEKATKVKFLKEQIEGEMRRIAHIEASTRYGGVEQDTSEEAAFYSQLQSDDR